VVSPGINCQLAFADEAATINMTVAVASKTFFISFSSEVHPTSVEWDTSVP
jgi:hypothetical protein